MCFHVDFLDFYVISTQSSVLCNVSLVSIAFTSHTSLQLSLLLNTTHITTTNILSTICNTLVLINNRPLLSPRIFLSQVREPWLLHLQQRWQRQRQWQRRRWQFCGQLSRQQRPTSDGGDRKLPHSGRAGHLWRVSACMLCVWRSFAAVFLDLFCVGKMHSKVVEPLTVHI